MSPSWDIQCELSVSMVLAHAFTGMCSWLILPFYQFLSNSLSRINYELIEAFVSQLIEPFVFHSRHRCSNNHYRQPLQHLLHCHPRLGSQLFGLLLHIHTSMVTLQQYMEHRKASLEFHEKNVIPSHNSATFYFMKNYNFLILAGSVPLPKMINHFLAIVYYCQYSKMSFFHDLKRDGITSLHGIHEGQFSRQNILEKINLLFSLHRKVWRQSWF